MTYCFTKTLNTSFDEAIEQATAALKEKGFGVLTTIDVKKTLKEKIDADFRPYTILGACNPNFAHQALQNEPKIGTMLPCNVIVEEVDGAIEVSAVDPLASMQAVENPALEGIAREVQSLLKEVIDAL
ncbi:MAG: DUF302 domain-containing protein [Alphaproteobacteria bacterium]|nr:DUF302 domain-containing protein [Alphaproteobacteria bacterium]MBT4086485.1 DUF302 domain-containing protein [Alphaproteobacteria bacterium]MBT4546465.1 DUF302 domain-containing protein [Alphaproteobacteria bacterium]MBT7745466.1 DUF302 domain-containing protein [Alphaproteobacteria bacterium]